MPEMRSKRRANEERKRPVGDTNISVRPCKKAYTPKPKRSAYDEETRKQALKIYYSGGVGAKWVSLWG